MCSGSFDGSVAVWDMEMTCLLSVFREPDSVRTLCAITETRKFDFLFFFFFYNFSIILKVFFHELSVEREFQ